MASAQPKRIDTIGRVAGKVYDSGITFEEAQYMVQGHSLSKPLPIPIVKSLEVGQSALGDLPFVDEAASKLHQFVDMVHPYEESHDLRELETIFMSNRYKDLPGKVGIKGQCPVDYTQQTFIVDNDDKSKTLFKIITLEGDAKLPYDRCKDMCQGFLMKINYGKMYRVGSVALQFMLERLPGWQVRYFTINSGTNPKRSSDENAIQAGFDFIKQHGPKTDLDNLATIFAEVHTEKEGCLIYGWSKQLVVRSCLNYGKGTIAARRKSFKHLTLFDICSWFLDLILVQCIGLFLTTTFTFLGDADVGKSPLIKVLAMLVSFFHIDNDGLDKEPGFRICNSFEHLRHEAGTKEDSEVYDDGFLEQEEAVRLKSFTENTEEESRTVEKYTTTTMIAHSGRFLGNNPIDVSVLPSADALRSNPSIPDKTFRQMIAPSFHPKTILDVRANFDAVLKRTNMFIFVHDPMPGVFFRIASSDEADVPFYPWPFNSPKVDLLTESCKDTYGLWKENKSAQPPENWSANMEWSLLWLKLCKSGIKPPRGKMVRGRTEIRDNLFQVDPTTITEIKPSIETLRQLLQDPSSMPHSKMSTVTKSRSRAQISSMPSVNPLRVWAHGYDQSIQSSGASASSAALPSASVAEPYPSVQSCANGLEDLNEQRAIMNSILGSAAAAHHGHSYSVDTPPRSARSSAKTCADGPEDLLEEQRVLNTLLHASASQHHGQTYSVLSSPEVDRQAKRHKRSSLDDSQGSDIHEDD